MYLNTITGLHGELVAFIRDEAAAEVDSLLCGWAVVKQPNPVFEARAYATHYVYYDSDLNQCACWGHYDMSLADARKDLMERIV